nr:lytic transglycosylase domain-containing protein [Polymorphobacter sp.]
MIPHVASSASTATAAIRLASAGQGIDFNYLLNQAKAESGLDPNAAAPTSSARGLFQFTAGTWLETIRKHGREHGLGEAAAALDGAVDPTTRAAILDLRRDPVASADMAASYTADNAAKLSTGLGRTATATDLSLAHFLGAAGALRFLKADPSAPASAINPAAARANPRIFFAADGSPRSVAQVHDHFAAIFGKPVPPTGTALPVTRQPALQLAAAPDAARMAYLLLAELSA